MFSVQCIYYLTPALESEHLQAGTWVAHCCIVRPGALSTLNNEGGCRGGEPALIQGPGISDLEPLWPHVSGQTHVSPAQALPHAARGTLTDLLPLPSLSLSRSPLVKAVFHTCRAMHTSLSGKADGQQSSFCHCERASGHLWSSLNVSGATCDLTLNHVSGG